MKRISLTFKKHQTTILLFSAIILGLCLLFLLLDVIGGIDKSKYKELTDMVIKVEHQDGTTETFTSRVFNFRSNEDVITIILPLDEEFRQHHQSINFFFYNSVVRAYYKDRLLVSYGENISRHMIGHIKVSIPIPPEAYGDEIRVQIYPRLNVLEDAFRTPLLMKEKDAAFFPVIGLEAFYVVFNAILIFSFLGIIIFAFLYKTVDVAREGTWLMMLIFAVTLWFLGNSGMLYVITASEDINAVGEYVGMFLIFAAAPLYASFETERPMLKKYLAIAGSVLFVVFWVCFICYILPTGFNYVWHLRQWQALQIVMAFSALISLLFPGKKKKNLSDHVMSYGFSAVALFGVLEQVRIIISAHVTEEWPMFMQRFIEIHFAILLILALVITLFTSYAIKVKYVLQKSLREQHLEMLAYTDNLTDIGNRQYLQKKLNELDQNREKDYAIIFADIDYLKYANDNFGHEAGDELIKMVAAAIKEAVEGNSKGFVGRNGGDEFICVAIPARTAEGIAQDIRKNLEEIKRQENPPFPVSVSIGIAHYREIFTQTNFLGRRTIDSSNVIKLADERMYKDKCIQKQKLQI